MKIRSNLKNGQCLKIGPPLKMLCKMLILNKLEAIGKWEWRNE
jgi:hypothetical protein